MKLVLVLFRMVQELIGQFTDQAMGGLAMGCGDREWWHSGQAFAMEIKRRGTP